MTTPRRSPLGAFYRSPLGVRASAGFSFLVQLEVGGVKYEFIWSTTDVAIGETVIVEDFSDLALVSTQLWESIDVPDDSADLPDGVVWNNGDYTGGGSETGQGEPPQKSVAISMLGYPQETTTIDGDITETADTVPGEDVVFSGEPCDYYHYWIRTINRGVGPKYTASSSSIGHYHPHHNYFKNLVSEEILLLYQEINSRFTLSHDGYRTNMSRHYGVMEYMGPISDDVSYSHDFIFNRDGLNNDEFGLKTFYPRDVHFLSDKGLNIAINVGTKHYGFYRVPVGTYKDWSDIHFQATIANILFSTDRTAPINSYERLTGLQDKIKEIAGSNIMSSFEIGNIT